MTALRAVVVGAGLMGRWHAAYLGRAGGRVVGVVDRDAGRGEAIARKHGATAWPDLAECLESIQSDVVHVCTGLESHAALARVALRGGRHVLVEKPLAATAEQVEELVALSATQRRLLAPVHQFPFQRGFARLRRGLQGLGPLVSVRYETNSAGGDGRSTDERRQILLEILPHPVSLFRALFETVPRAESWTVSAFTADDLALSVLQGDTRLEIAVSLRGRPTRNQLTALGTRGTLRADLFHGFASRAGGAASRLDKVLGPFREGASVVTSAGWNLALRALRREPAYPGLPQLISRFYTAARAGTASPIAAAEVLDAALLADEVRRRASLRESASA